MTENCPRISVGLPVYNGERFLGEAIDAVLNQTFRDLELIISDNASTDRTAQICRDYAAKDNRIRYYRNEANIGANPNFRRVFALSRAEYFKWVTHDDLQTLDFLGKSIVIMDQNPDVVVCYPRVKVIDETGNTIKHRSYGLETDPKLLRRPQDRLGRILWINWGSPPIYGLMRASILRKTPLLGTTYAADQILLAELALHGRFYELPEDLLLHREHVYRSVYTNPSRHSLMAFQDPANAKGIIFPAWRVLRDYLASIWRAPLGWSARMACFVQMLRWVKYHRGELFEDLTIAAKQIVGRSTDRQAHA
jgi:glycosyltransferase involved in cell wall biosynthesis